jgi:hypothetical protein
MTSSVIGPKSGEGRPWGLVDGARAETGGVDDAVLPKLP